MELHWVQLLLSRRSIKNLRDYLSENLDLIPHPLTSFHSTIVHSKERPLVVKRDLIRKIDNGFPIQISPDSYLLYTFGSKLLLRYDHPSIRRIYNQIASNGLNQPTRRPSNSREKQFYQEPPPHIIISKYFRGDVESLPPFTDSLIFNTCYWGA